MYRVIIEKTEIEATKTWWGSTKEKVVIQEVYHQELETLNVEAVITLINGGRKDDK